MHYDKVPQPVNSAKQHLSAGGNLNPQRDAVSRVPLNY